MTQSNTEQTIWHERWSEGRIGFHREAVNAHLMAHASVVLNESRRVLVPLCGKSVDMPWLAQQGVEVVGVELVDTAVRAFWEAQDVQPQHDSFHSFQRSTHGKITVLQGDIFALHEAHTGTIDAIYDRAALIAIPPDQQQRYADHLLGLLKPGGTLLLLTYDMPVPAQQGPPFSVHPDRVPQLYAAASQVVLVDTVMHTPETEPRLASRGVPWAREGIWKIVR